VSVPQVPAIVLAGGQAGPDLAAATGQRCRAMVPVAGKPMVVHVCDALLQATTVSSILVVGDVPAPEGCSQTGDHGGFAENLFAGLRVVGNGELVLVSTCDIPFVTPAAFDDLVRRGVELRADVVYPIVHVAACYRRFPGVKRTSLRLREGVFTGGNAMLVNGAFVRAHADQIASAYAARKSPARLASMIGLGTLARLVGAMTVFPNALELAALEAAVGRLLGGAVARALVSDYPEVATDIDRLTDLQAVASSG